MIRNILTLPSHRRALHTPCLEVSPTHDWIGVLKDLKDTLCATKYAVGLAAPQIGSIFRIFVVRDGVTLLEFINPAVLQTSTETRTGEEGCLSLPDCRARVNRAVWVRVVPIQIAGRQPHQVIFQGELARRVLHELDHLDGILITDREAQAARQRQVTDA